MQKRIHHYIRLRHIIHLAALKHSRLFFTSHHPTRDIYIASSNIMTRIICSWRDPIPTLIIPPLYPIFRHSNRRVRCLLVLHSSLSHSFLLFLSLVLFHSLSLVHMNTSKHTDLRKIFFSFSLESGIQFCAIIGTPYWISPLPIKRHRGTIFFCNVRGRPLGNEGHTIAISRVKFTERYFAIQWKGIQSVRRERERETRLLVSSSPSPPSYPSSDGFLDERPCTREFESKISPRIDIASYT